MALCISLGKDAIANGFCCLALGDGMVARGRFKVAYDSNVTLPVELSKEAKEANLKVIEETRLTYEALYEQKDLPKDFYEHSMKIFGLMKQCIEQIQETKPSTLSSLISAEEKDQNNDQKEATQ